MAVETEGTNPLIDETPDLADALAAAFGDEQAPQDEPIVTSETSTPDFYTLSDGTQVPFEELEKGYLRQSDYTKKTQALAQERQAAEQALALMNALVENPADTLAALQANLLADNEQNLLDPTEAKLAEYDQRFQQIEQTEFERQLDVVLGSLEQQYADFDRDAVLEWAVEHEIPNLQAAYLHMRETQAYEQERAQHNAQAMQAKRSAPPVAGRGTQPGGSVPEYREVNTLADAMANALLELQSNGSI